ncbi:MAG: TIGR03663 family protein, partial [Roseiflexaceae bacterium]|nr:TIGR03663 family protein [Roseiflexaceae bacterium]
MSVAELPPSAAEPQPLLATTRPASAWNLTVEQAVYLALFTIAIVAHVWGLGTRAYHHDETHHAFFSWRVYQGQGYTHDPLLHGPFLYFANAFVYFLFGDTNVTARLSVALFGSALVLMPYLVRRELGRSAALIAALYLTVSPVFLYVGRFIRHDPFAVAFELLAFIGIVRYVSTRRPLYLYLVAAALGLMCVTMESFFLYVAIMLPLVLGLFLWRVWKPGLLILAATAVAVAAFMFVLPGEPVRSAGSVVRDGGSYQCP